jgi:membrane-associated phospholipid phosphatase
MGWGTGRDASEPRALLPGSLRPAGAALLAACVAAVLAAFVAGRGHPGRLDTALDPRIQAWLGRFPTLLTELPRLGGLKEVALLTAALALACVATRRWSGAVLAVVAVPGAVGLTEYVLKPYVGSLLDQAFPSGHATSSFALAAIFAILLADPAYRRVPGALRLLLALMALLLAVAVAAAMIAIGAHTFTDAVAGAAVGTGVVLACALTLDLAVRRAWRRVGPERSTMTSSPESQHLDNRHRNTLRQIFQHPVSHNIEWHAVTSLLDAIGTVEVHHDGQVAIRVGSQSAFFTHPDGKDIDEQMVLDLRRLLSKAGYEPS